MTKVYNISFLILAFCSISVFAQRTYETNPDRKRGFNWMFGDSIWLDFKTNPPTQKNGSQLKALESAATISDTAGNLLFYTDGMTVWNANHQIIKNGTGLHGNESSSQGCLFIPQPNNDSVFYLFTTDWQGKSKGFCYHKIILNANADSSVVIEKNIKLLPSVFESISATTHANGLWKWVVVRNASGKGINAFLITDKGINSCPIYSETQINAVYSIFSCQSKSAFSINSMLFCVSYLSDSYNEFLFFNNFNGKFQQKNVIQVNTPTGITFAKNNKNCYIAERDYNIYNINNITGSIISINNHNDSFMIIGSRLTPYNQIYYNIFDSTFLGLVDKPELANAKFKRKSLLLNKKCTNELTNFDNSYNYTPGVNFNYTINCSNNKVNFKGQDTFNATNHLWQYRLIPNSNWITFNNVNKNVDFLFNDSGLYQIRYIVTNNIIKDTCDKSIWIGKPILQNFLGRDTGYCVGSFPTIILQLPTNLQCYKWNTDSLGSSISVNKAGKFIATITTNTMCQMSDTINLYEDTVIIKPNIIRKGDSLSSSVNATHFRWYRNDILISLEKAIKMREKGVYQLMVMGNGGCETWSDTFQVNNLSVNGNYFENINIYPIPTSDLLNITGLNANKNYTIIITNINGKLMETYKVNNTNQVIINLKDLDNGLYILSIQNYQAPTYNIKLLKQQ